MILNTLCILLMGVGTVYAGRKMWSESVPTVQPVTPWGEQVGKTHHIQSMTKDASMATERKRRQVIHMVDPLKLKETKTQLGSTTGAIEKHFLSSLFVK